MQAARDQPFGSAIAQLVGASTTVFASTPWSKNYSLPPARRANPGVPLMDSDIWHSTLVLASMYVMRFLDCWTDAGLSLLLWRVADTKQCYWFTRYIGCVRMAQPVLRMRLNTIERHRDALYSVLQRATCYLSSNRALMLTASSCCHSDFEIEHHQPAPTTVVLCHKAPWSVPAGVAGTM